MPSLIYIVPRFDFTLYASTRSLQKALLQSKYCGPARTMSKLGHVDTKVLGGTVDRVEEIDINPEEERALVSPCTQYISTWTESNLNSRYGVWICSS
jgi:hypothetical protein